jgi:hypothetical protein
MLFGKPLSEVQNHMNTAMHTHISGNSVSSIWMKMRIVVPGIQKPEKNASSVRISLSG